MNCLRCRSVISDDSVFCRFCGQEQLFQNSKCDHCGGDIEGADTAFCPHCGAAQKHRGAGVVRGKINRVLSDVKSRERIIYKAITLILCALMLAASFLPLFQANINDLVKPSEDRELSGLEDIKINISAIDIIRGLLSAKSIHELENQIAENIYNKLSENELTEREKLELKRAVDNADFSLLFVSREVREQAPASTALIIIIALCALLSALVSLVSVAVTLLSMLFKFRLKFVGLCYIIPLGISVFILALQKCNMFYAFGAGAAPIGTLIISLAGILILAVHVHLPRKEDSPNILGQCRWAYTPQKFCIRFFSIAFAALMVFTVGLDFLNVTVEYEKKLSGDDSYYSTQSIIEIRALDVLSVWDYELNRGKDEVEDIYTRWLDDRTSEIVESLAENTEPDLLVTDAVLLFFNDVISPSSDIIKSLPIIYAALVVLLVVWIACNINDMLRGRKRRWPDIVFCIIAMAAVLAIYIITSNCCTYFKECGFAGYISIKQGIGAVLSIIFQQSFALFLAVAGGITARKKRRRN